MGPRIRFITFALAFLSLLVMLGCAPSQPLVRSDYDPNVDFSRYRTYGYFDTLATDKTYTTLLTQYLKDAVDYEMKRRGYRFSDQPDLLINFHAKLEEKQRIVQNPTPGYYYGYRWGYYGPWGGYTYNTYVQDYTEGTLNIDIVDRVRKQMVWEGVAIGRVRRKDFDHLKEVVADAVAAIFAKYPFRAGTQPP